MSTLTGIPTTNVDVVDNIKRVDNTQEVYEVWNEDVPVDVNDLRSDVEVTEKSALGGVTTTKWDQPLTVIPEVTTATKVSPTGTGRSISWGAVNSDQQHEYVATQSNCVGSIANVNNKLPILGIGNR